MPMKFREIGTIPPEMYRVTECCYCGRHYDTKTRQYVKKRKKVVSWGICDGCYRKHVTDVTGN
jgi:hypothetical protein